MSTTAARTTRHPIHPTSSRISTGRRFAAAIRRLRPHGHAAAPAKPLPPSNAPERLFRSEIRDAQVRQFGFHSRIC